MKVSSRTRSLSFVLLFALSLLVGGVNPAEGRCLVVTVTAPTSIDRTGATDVHDAIQAFLDSVPNGCGAGAHPYTTVLFPDNAVYWSEKPLTLTNKTWVLVEGQRSSSVAKTVFEVKTPCTYPTPPCDTTYKQTDRGQVAVLGGSHVAVNDLHLIGAHPQPGHYNASYEGQFGIAFLSTVSSSAVGNVITHPYGDGFIVWEWQNVSCATAVDWFCGGPGTPSSNIQIGALGNNGCQPNTVVGAGRHGVAIVNAYSVTAQCNTFSSDTADWSVGEWGVDIEADIPAQRTDTITIDRNEFGGPHLGAVAMSSPNTTHDVTVSNNHVSRDPAGGCGTPNFWAGPGCTGFYVTVNPGTGYTFANITIRGNSSDQIHGYSPGSITMHDTAVWTVDTNTAPGYVDGAGNRWPFMAIWCTTGGMITNNTIIGAAPVYTQGEPSLNYPDPCAGTPGYDLPIVTGNQQ